MARGKKKTRTPSGHQRRSYWLPILLGATALGFLAGALVIHLFPGKGRTSPDAGRTPAPPAIFPAFTDVTTRAGVRFQHQAGSTGKFYYPEVMGAGCAFFDFDGDGNQDIYLVNGNLLPPDSPSKEFTNVLLRNKGDGTFEDVTERAGVGDPSYGQGCCTADYDGDGDQDLYVTNFGPNVLYRNKGNGTFERVEGILSDPGWGQACAFFDADGDGHLDLYLQNYLVYSLEKRQDWYVSIGGKRVLDYCSPSGYNGQQDRLFRNLGDGTFRDITTECGIVAPEGTGMGLACSDLDGDGDLDIAVSNDSRPNFYFQNDGKGHFTECALVLGLGFNSEGGTEAFMGIDVGDYDGDLLQDLVIPSLRTQGFSLYRNLGSMFRDVSGPTGVDAATSSVTGFAPVFLDYDSDGDLDLFFTAGEVRMGRTPAGAGASFNERYAMADLLLENRNASFVNVSNLAGGCFQERRVSRACSPGDFDNDGDPDLLVTAMNGEAVLLRNDTKGGNWIGFRLEGMPPNRDAVGARLYLTAGGRTLLRENYAGGSYLGQRDRRQLFGLGEVRRIDALRVRWPGGEESSYRDLEINRYHTLRQEN